MIDYVFDTNLKNNLSNLADSIETDGYYLYEKALTKMKNTVIIMT